MISCRVCTYIYIRLAVSKQAAQKFDVERFKPRKLSELEVRKEYLTKISKILQIRRT